MKNILPPEKSEFCWFVEPWKAAEDLIKLTLTGEYHSSCCGRRWACGPTLNSIHVQYQLYCLVSVDGKFLLLFGFCRWKIHIIVWFL